MPSKDYSSSWGIHHDTSSWHDLRPLINLQTGDQCIDTTAVTANGTLGRLPVDEWDKMLKRRPKRSPRANKRLLLFCPPSSIKSLPKSKCILIAKHRKEAMVVSKESYHMLIL
ncbi:hypothetical protein TNCT_430781 [Trichonephila clavata]|uniref:Uncharacterized protein n=1 Tax=Trichonephila clavata TaxID=2740835 RepID=A0A8X6H0K4_TRICU|nr:hypothetical protein TNCT_430781 [Trichonephila clavata]